MFIGPVGMRAGRDSEEPQALGPGIINGLDKEELGEEHLIGSSSLRRRAMELLASGVASGRFRWTSSPAVEADGPPQPHPRHALRHCNLIRALPELKPISIILLASLS